MLRFRPGPTSLRRTETRLRPPCAVWISRPSRRSKTDTRSPVAPLAQSEDQKSQTAFSCDDAKPLHFSVKPNPINYQRGGTGERRDRARQINWRAFNQIDPNEIGRASCRERV